MAEALTDQLSGGQVEAHSAGSQPTRLHPNTVEVMRSYGLDLAGRRAKHLDEYAGQQLDYVVTLCDRVREVCPEFGGPELGGPARHLHWSIANPAEPARSDRASYPAYVQVAAELAARIALFLDLAAHDQEAG